MGANLDGVKKDVGRTNVNVQKLQVGLEMTNENVAALREGQKVTNTNVQALKGDLAATNSTVHSLREAIEKSINPEIEALKDGLSKSNLSQKLREDHERTKAGQQEQKEAL